jgi:thiamine biosynthesis lipoprotein ApbE
VATGLAAVTVVAGSATRAEALTKAAFVAGPEEGAALVTAAGATGILVSTSGACLPLPGLEEFLA